jgi:signal transduction histidine kinase
MKRLEAVLGPLRHELRNTLSPITMIADVLALRDGGAELEMLVRDVRELALLVEDMSAVTRETHSNRPIRTRAVDLARVVATTLETLALHLAQRAASVRVEIPPKLRVQADPSCLEIALGSALRHCAQASNQIALAAVRDGRTVRLRISPLNAALPAPAALVVCRQLVEAQRGTFTIGDGLELSLPIALTK